MCGKVLKGIDVDPEHLALDVIEAVGPGGSFMISDQKNRELWEKDGALDARARGRQIARKILAEAPMSYITQELDAAVRKKFKY
jgi:trimethylamine--corrinoid protein Co-methyltransferase